MGKKSDLSPECQKFVKKLFAFYSKEKATKKPIVTFDRVSGADGYFVWKFAILRQKSRLQNIPPTPNLQF